MPVYQSRHLQVLLQPLLVKLWSLWPLLQLQMNHERTKWHSFVWHSLPGHFTHAAICVYMWRQGWLKDTHLLRCSQHSRTLTAGAAAMSRCSDKMWKGSYYPSSARWRRCRSEWLAIRLFRERQVWDVLGLSVQKWLEDWYNPSIWSGRNNCRTVFYRNQRVPSLRTYEKIFETRTLVKTQHN